MYNCKQLVCCVFVCDIQTFGNRNTTVAVSSLAPFLMDLVSSIKPYRQLILACRLAVGIGMVSKLAGVKNWLANFTSFSI